MPSNTSLNNESASLIHSNRLNNKYDNLLEEYTKWTDDVLKKTGLFYNQGMIIKLLDPAENNLLSFMHTFNLLVNRVLVLDSLILERGTLVNEISKVKFCLNTFLHYLYVDNVNMHNIFLIGLSNLDNQLNNILDNNNDFQSQNVDVNSLGSPISNNSIRTTAHVLEVDNKTEPSMRRGQLEYNNSRMNHSSTFFAQTINNSSSQAINSDDRYIGRINRANLPSLESINEFKEIFNLECHVHLIDFFEKVTRFIAEQESNPNYPLAN